MDAFYASVEQRDRPELRGKPVIVGGHPTRGVVLAASYEVRKFGVRSAMPMSQALRAAPQALVVPPRFSAYTAASERVFDVFARFTPEVEPLSLDEAFLDVTASVKLFGPPAQQASAIRKAIWDELNLPASAGIAPVKFAAKIASDLAKPNGQREVPHDGVAEFLAPLPVERLWGVGPKLAGALKRLGIHKIGQLARFDASLLRTEVGDGAADLISLAQGHDERVVVPDRQAKRVGAEETFDEDLFGSAALAPHLLEQSLRVARRLRRAELKAHTAHLKVKYADFEVVTRSQKLPRPTDDEQELYRAAKEMLLRVPLEKKVRLTGVAGMDLVGAGQEGQLGLFGNERDSRREALHKSLDKIAERFGEDAVTLGTLVGRTHGH
ncbi:MAG: DNA polymerase IV [Deltaproteobacteria bacterium]|nr:DNA polymerase IV [Deltaproteobacteria bacterium]